MQRGPQPPSAHNKGMDQLWLTNFRLIFCSDSAQPAPFALPIPLLSIAKVERLGDAAGAGPGAQALQPLLLVVGPQPWLSAVPLQRSFLNFRECLLFVVHKARGNINVSRNSRI